MVRSCPLKKPGLGAPSVRKVPQAAFISKLILLNGVAISTMPFFLLILGCDVIAAFQSA